MNPQNPQIVTGPAGAETTQDAAQLRTDIAQTRNEMGATLEQLHAKLNPTVLKEQAVEQLGEMKEHLKKELQEAKDALKAEMKAELSEAKSVVREATVGKVEHIMHDAQTSFKSTTRSFSDTIAENPIPAALAGVGLAWLIFNARRTAESKQFTSGHQYDPQTGAYLGGGGRARGMAAARNTVEHGYESVREGAQSVAQRVQQGAQGVAHRASDVVHQAGDRVGGLAHDASQRVGELAHDARDRVGALAHDASGRVTNLAHGASDTVSHAAHDASEYARHMADGTVRRGRQVGTSIATQFDANPLLVGAAVVAVGTIVGLSIPITRKEGQVMGGVRDQVMHKAEHFAHDAVEQLSSAAKHAVDDAKSKLEGSNEKDGSKGGDAKKDGNVGGGQAKSTSQMPGNASASSQLGSQRSSGDDKRVGGVGGNNNGNTATGSSQKTS